VSGQPIFTRRSGANSVILQNVFSAQHNEELLDQLASAQFQTDWGMRGVAEDSPIFDPYSYATGSVFALHSTNTALTFWKAHRPDAAFSLWSGILPWNTLDSLGHLHEVLAGNFYHQQLESVPEQTWSSAGLLDASVRGLLGLDINGLQNKVTFAPHLPAQWSAVSVKNIRMPHAALDFTLHQTAESLDLEIHNNGKPVKILYEPRLPLGARLARADVDGHAVGVEARHFPEEDQAHLEIEAPPGSSHCHLQFVGGVSLILKSRPLEISNISTGMKITNLKWSNNTLSITADIFSAGENTILLRTPLKVVGATGATVRLISDETYKLTVPFSTLGEDQPTYKRSAIEITFFDAHRH
jgi:hypothetical protein